MSNTVAVPTLTPIIEAESSSKVEISVQKPVLKVVPQQPTEPPTLEIVKQMYASQDRECWLCQGISKKIAEGKEISEDDNWHFTSCVLSWEYLHRKS
ncbi:MAG TPA: hypothetical protein PLM07_02260 [Candidatus Rifleibacterium sp.]|nr:hypothetical protein [Candidatus Rifleibacterium sp.]HPT44705.1 hypothetical protein [Candidatus Rifleibacterium sp.]